MNVNQALLKIKELSNKIHTLPLSSNKGGVGHYIELSIGLQLNSECLDLVDGEIKAFPLKKNKSSDILTAKETIAITMTDRDKLKSDLFCDSRLFKKINRVIFVPYFRKGTNVLIFEPIFMEHKNSSVNSKKMNSTDPIFMEHKNSINLFDKLKKDYELIQKMFNENGRIESKYGELIQSRTKGQKNSNSRAYYFKTNYVREYLIPHINFNDNKIKELIKIVCI
jgi:hypothetical protein